MEYKEFENLLGSWSDKLRPFIESEQCDKIYELLKRRSKLYKVVPLWENVYNAYKYCPLSEIKIVIVGFDPYPQRFNRIPVADGIAFSSSTTEKIPDSLVSFLNGIIDNIYPGFKDDIIYSKAKDLKYLSEQGILLTNYSLTTEASKIGIHSDLALWEPFHKYVIEEILFDKSLVYILMGKYAQKLYKYIIPFNNLVINVEHPSYAARSLSKWDHKHCFSKSEKFLEKKINWLPDIDRDAYLF